MRNHFRLKNKVTKERIKKALLETFLNYKKKKINTNQ